jgi:hypothetical protein
MFDQTMMDEKFLRREGESKVEYRVRVLQQLQLLFELIGEVEGEETEPAPGAEAIATVLRSMNIIACNALECHERKQRKLRR